jgi:hypothetical protein
MGHDDPFSVPVQIVGRTRQPADNLPASNGWLIARQWFEPVRQLRGVLTVMKYGDDLDELIVIVDAIPKLVGEDTQADPSSPTVNDRLCVREVFESSRGRVELVDESFGLIGCLHVVPGESRISITPGIRGESDVVRHATWRRERTSRSSSSSVT